MNRGISRSGIRIWVLLTTTLTLGAPAVAEVSPELSRQVIESVDADTERLTGIFKDIHEHPELGLMETRTAGILTEELEKLGYDVTTGIGRTGLVAIMRNGDGPVVLWRADMDAVPVKEATGVPYASEVTAIGEDGTEVPVGHLCGHDAHMTWMLGMAKVMAALRDQWQGTLVIVGQPAEEPITGAAAMVEDGLWEKYGVPAPDYAMAMHTAPLPTGILVGVGGVIMAGTEQVDVTFHGVGGHGSSPQFTKDPVIMATYAIAQYQAIVSRVLDPRDPAVITVGAVEAGTTNNVIPENATLKMNFRFFQEDVRDQLFNGVREISNGIARTYGMPEDQLPTIVRKGYATVTENDPELVERTNTAVLEAGLVNDETLITTFRAVTGSEDFPMLIKDVDGVQAAYKFLGTAPPEIFEQARKEGKEIPWANHNPMFLVDLKALPIGAKIASVSVLELLAN